MFPLESPHQGDSNQYTEHTIINIKRKSPQVKVKVSHSLIAVGAVGVRVPLYLGHS